MREPPPPLDDELEALLSPGRAVPEVSAERMNAVLSRVHQTVALSPPAPPPHPSPALNPWWMAGGGLLVGLLVGSAFTWATLQTVPEGAAVEKSQDRASAPAAQNPEASGGSAEHSEGDGEERPSPTENESEQRRANDVGPAPSPRIRTVAPSHPVRTPGEDGATPPSEEHTEPLSEERVEPSVEESPASENSGNTLVAERRIIDAALAQVSRGNPAAALRTVARHQERYPNGQLAEPREIVRTRALIALGRLQEAREALRRMEIRFPQSAAAASLRDSLTTR